jgi:hypothetical protein
LILQKSIKNIIVWLICLFFLEGCSIASTKKIGFQMETVQTLQNPPSSSVDESELITKTVFTTPFDENSDNNFSSSFQEGRLTIEVTNAQVYSDPTFSQIFKFGLQFSGTLPASMSDLNNFFPVKEVKFFLIDGEQETPFDVEQIGGGGGGPGLLADGTFSLDQDFTYKVVTPLSANKNFLIKAKVITNETLGISHPINFEVNIIPDQANRPG